MNVNFITKGQKNLVTIEMYPLCMQMNTKFSSQGQINSETFFEDEFCIHIVAESGGITAKG